MEPSELAAVAGRYRDMIYRVALHWCGHPQEAEDATQDTPVSYNHLTLPTNYPV